MQGNNSFFFIKKYNASEEDNDEKECDGSVKPLHTPLLTFLHAVSLQQEVWEKITFTFAWIPIPSLLLWLLDCQLNSVQGGCHFGRVSLFPYIVIKAWFSPWPGSHETRCARWMDRPWAIWARFKGGVLRCMRGAGWKPMSCHSQIWLW